MKRCAECGRNYNDDSMSFCLDDGAELLFGPVSVNEPATAILSEPGAAETGFRSGEAKTNVFQNTGAAAMQNSNSIAVLPFVNMSADAENEYFCDGLAEELLNALAKIDDLKVAARTSAFSFKGKNVGVNQIGTALRVKAVLEGSVRQSGNRLRISVQLVDAADGYHLWSERYDREMQDIFDVQDEITLAVVDALKLKLLGTEKAAVVKRHTENTEAYQLYLNGLFHRQKGGFENGRKALNYYNQALALDPNFALAHIGAAEVYIFLGANSLIDPREAHEKAKGAVQKALALDETLAEAHATLGSIQKDEWEWAEAECEYKRAIELNPNLPRAHNNYAIYLSVLGRQTEALTEIERALELDPLDLRYRAMEGQMLCFARRYDEAIQKFQDILRIDSNRSVTHILLADTFASKGEHSEAIDHYRKSIEIEGETSSTQCCLGYALARLGKRDEALALLVKLKTTNEYVSPGELAFLYAGLGDKEQALASLEKAYGAHDLHLQFLKVEPRYDSLRADPRFQDLMRRVGLPQ